LVVKLADSLLQCCCSAAAAAAAVLLLLGSAAAAAVTCGCVKWCSVALGSRPAASMASRIWWYLQQQQQQRSSKHTSSSSSCIVVLFRLACDQPIYQQPGSLHGVKNLVVPAGAAITAAAAANHTSGWAAGPKTTQCSSGLPSICGLHHGQAAYALFWLAHRKVLTPGNSSNQ
jgi:hypothetical protein